MAEIENTTENIEVEETEGGLETEGVEAEGQGEGALNPGPPEDKDLPEGTIVETPKGPAIIQAPFICIKCGKNFEAELDKEGKRLVCDCGGAVIKH